MQYIPYTKYFKWILFTLAGLIIFLSLLASHFLVRDLKQEEFHKMSIWAEAMRTLNQADGDTDLNLVLKVLHANHTIPVILLDSSGEVQDTRNVDKDTYKTADDLVRLAQKLRDSGHVIRIRLNNGSQQADYMEVCYDDSVLLKRLALYPYVWLSVGLIFVVLTIFALLSVKRAEQNKIWMGLCRETAHQLGTPISSLLAWSEVLSDRYHGDPLLDDMRQDIERLSKVADRFSKIGSKPKLQPCDIDLLLSEAIHYMQRRSPANITYHYRPSSSQLQTNVNGSLFEWVIENLLKNAVDAIGGQSGSITISTLLRPNHIRIDVQDTGRGIRKNDLHNIFKPGFSTKKRGWGLGLSLSRRIIDDYHGGKLRVKQSQPGVGTTFRIQLPLPSQSDVS